MKSNQQGSILLIFIITLPFLILITAYYMRLSLTSYQVAHFDEYHTMAQMAADAGADYGVEQLLADNSWTGTGSEVTLHNSGNVKTTFQDSVSGDSTTQTITVTGRTYFPATAATPSRTVRVAVDLYPVSGGDYSILTGAGGLIMSNNSKVVGGAVFVNGTITMSNSASIGLSTNPVNVQAADAVCPVPADSTYPRVCTSADGQPEPISMSNSAHIYGQVTANNQTTGNNMTNPGLTSGTVTPGALPTYDRAGQKAAVVNNLTGSQASCSGKKNVIWPANTKITGDVTLSNQCTVTVQGNVWITGSLSPSNSSQIIVANVLGSTRPVIMIDGGSGLSFANGASVTANASGTGAEFITFYCGASCSVDSATLTGSALAASRGIQTINIGNNTSAINSIFYAYWSEATMGNSGSIGAVVGQTVQLVNQGTITFGSSVSGGNTVWVVKGYRKL
ncbi:MAG TPA: hypothetical protein VHB51_01455 [Candidatus Saccharimonadales bacterium]|nr:hypothetical protein [Candidatus Saccharimonadales bacterium]